MISIDGYPDQPGMPLQDCEAVMECLQTALDGAIPWQTAGQWTASHRSRCRQCAERWQAAQVLQLLLPRRQNGPVATNPGTLATPAPLAQSCGLRVWRKNDRFRYWLLTGTGMLAAALMVAMLLPVLQRQDPPDRSQQARQSAPPVVGNHVPSGEIPTVRAEASGPSPGAPSPAGDAPSAPVAGTEAVAPAPATPLRLQHEVAKAAEAILETVDEWAEPPLWPARPAAVTPRPLPQSPPDPWTQLWLSVRTGLEPVTTTTQRAFDRLMQDLGAWQPQPSPKS
ncbi:MAG: hypothetical protein NZU63_10085 [Gemmataceae bacterium]|nr:hypothetical protein [Gemmataceae bacterium]